MKTAWSIVLLFLPLAFSPAAEKSQTYEVRYSLGRVYESYLDPRVLTGDAHESITGAYQAFSFHHELVNYFDNELNWGLALLNIKGDHLQVVRDIVVIDSRFSAFLHVSIVKRFEKFKFRYGVGSMITMSENSRSRLLEAKASDSVTIDRGMSIDTRLSLALPSLGLYFFPDQQQGADLGFLDKNSNFVQGWFTSSIWYRFSDETKVFLGVEFLNQDNFNHGWIEFLDSGSSLFLRYQHDFGPALGAKTLVQTKLGMVINPSRVENSGVILAGDRLFFEVGLGVSF